MDPTGNGDCAFFRNLFLNCKFRWPDCYQPICMHQCRSVDAFCWNNWQFTTRCLYICLGLQPFLIICSGHFLSFSGWDDESSSSFHDMSLRCLCWDPPRVEHMVILLHEKLRNHMFNDFFGKFVYYLKICFFKHSQWPIRIFAPSTLWEQL